MKDEKNIENIIREKLENFQATPPPHIWNNVQGQLAARRHKNRLVYMGWISAAAIVVLAFLAGWYFNDNLKSKTISSAGNEIIQPERNNATRFQSAEIEDKQPVLTNSTNNKTNGIDVNQMTAVLPVASNKKLSTRNVSKNTFNFREDFNMRMMESLNAQVAKNQQPNALLALHTKTIPANYITESEQLLIAENIKNLNKTAKPDNNWKMGMYIAPGYSSYSSNYSETYAQNMNYSGSNGNANVGGGFSVQYKTGKHWIVESGVYYAQNGQQSENSANIFARNESADYALAESSLSYFSNEVRVENNTMAMNSAAGIIQFSSTPKGAELTGNFEAKNTGVANLVLPNGEFSQVFEFMEIPLYVRYRVLDRKIGVELLTGFNTGIIVGNNAYIENQYGVQNIGETADISTFNIAGTLGMGVNYALGKHFSVAVEPRFSYYLNSINSNPSVEFRPYRMGFYTGVTYEF